MLWRVVRFLSFGAFSRALPRPFRYSSSNLSKHSNAACNTQFHNESLLPTLNRTLIHQFNTQKHVKIKEINRKEIRCVHTRFSKHCFTFRSSLKFLVILFDISLSLGRINSLKIDIVAQETPKKYIFYIQTPWNETLHDRKPFEIEISLPTFRK